MYRQEVESIVDVAVKKRTKMAAGFTRYLVSAMLAGAYVGFGIILIYTLGAPLAASHSDFQYLVMGACFGISLTLVVFAGAELFTGSNMYFTISTLAGKTTISDTLKNWAVLFAGNLLGGVGLALLIAGAGLFDGAGPEHLIFAAAAKKMSLPYSELFFRGILCNWLVCLALWMANRAKTEAAKLVLIWWCLFAFIASGYEHSVANMTLLSLAVILPNHPETITLAGWFHNLIPVTMGNIVGGSIFVGLAYWFVSPAKTKPEPERPDEEAE